MELDDLTLKAISPGTRRDIVRLLSNRPYTPSEISKILGKHVTTVAEHLAVLEKSGMVSRQERSKWVYYRLTPKGADILRPGQSWALPILSIASLLVGSFLYAASSPQLFAISEMSTSGAAPAASAAVDTAVVETPAAGTLSLTGLIGPIGILLIVLALLGFGYLARNYLRARTLRNQSVYIK